jgi:hypothetical protein
MTDLSKPFDPTLAGKVLPFMADRSDDGRIIVFGGTLPSWVMRSASGVWSKTLPLTVDELKDDWSILPDKEASTLAQEALASLGDG